jgi:hypothetical protein
VDRDVLKESQMSESVKSEDTLLGDAEVLPQLARCYLENNLLPFEEGLIRRFLKLVANLDQCG